MLSFPIFNSLCRFSCCSKFTFTDWFWLFNSWLIKWDLPDAEGPARIMSCLFEGVTLFAVINAWVWNLAGLSDDGWLTQLLIVKLFYFGRQFFDLTRFVFLGLFGVGDNWVKMLGCGFGLVCCCDGPVVPVPRFYVAEAGQSSQAGSTNKRPKQEAVVLYI